MDIAYAFFTMVLSQHYDLDIDETILQFLSEQEFSLYKKGQPSTKNELSEIKDLAKFHPLGSYLAVITYLEKKMYELGVQLNLEREFHMRPYWLFSSHKLLERYGVTFPEELTNRLTEIRRIRNAVSHGKKDPTDAEVLTAISTVEDFEKHVSQFNIEELRIKAKQILEQEKIDREKAREQLTRSPPDAAL